MSSLEDATTGAAATDTALAPRRPVGVTRTYREPTPAGVLRNLEQAMGGRPGLVSALLHNPADDSLAYVIGLIADPRNDARSLADLCADGRITVGELLEAYKRGAVAAAQVAAITQVAAHLPAVTADIMARAQPYYESCRACQGTGQTTAEPSRKVQNPQPKPCDNCAATGQVIVQPDLERQKVALELGGLGPKRAPLIDQSDRRKLVLPGGAESLVGLFTAVDQLLYQRRSGAEAPPEATPRGAVIDADVTLGETVPTSPSPPSSEV